MSWTFDDLTTVCITLRGEGHERIHGGQGPGTARAAAHFAASSVHPVRFFYGLPAERLGVDTKRTYDLNFPGKGLTIGPRPTGCWLSHRALWAACLLTDGKAFFVLEDDAEFPAGWRPRLEDALSKLPPDWDLLWVGHCCAADKPKRHVGGDVYECRPFCTHGYVVARKALEVLIDTQDAAGCYAPIDISLALHSMPVLRTFAVIPRIVGQHGTVLTP